MNEFPKQLWFKDYPNYVFEFLEEKNVEGYALYICRNSSVEEIRRVHVSSFNGVTKVGFFSEKEMLEHKVFLLERELEYWKTQLGEMMIEQFKEILEQLEPRRKD